MAASGSIPWVVAGLIALFLVGLVRQKLAKLSDRTQREVPMRLEQVVTRSPIVGRTLSEIVWAVGTSATAGALSA